MARFDKTEVEFFLRNWDPAPPLAGPIIFWYNFLENGSIVTVLEKAFIRKKKYSTG